MGRVRPFFDVTNQVLQEAGVSLPLPAGATTTAETTAAAAATGRATAAAEARKGRSFPMKSGPKP